VKFVKLNSRIVRYLLIGLYNTVIGYFIFWLVNYILANIVHYLVILCVSFMLSLTHAYIGQRYIVFRSTASWWKEYFRFLSVNISGLIINAFLLVLFVESGVGLMVSQAISMLIVTIISYYGHRYFSFKAS